MRHMNHRLAAAVLAAASCSCFAQGYPSKPVTIIVPFSVGTPQDILSRVAGKAMGERIGTSIIVDNRAGASGSIGNGMVGKAPPDGYTLLMTSTSFIISKALNPSFTYEPLKQYSPIALLATGDMGFFVSADTPAQSFGELLALAKLKPGALNYSSPGNGTPQHLAMELFKLESKINVQHIPYKDNTGSVNAVAAGQVNLLISPIVANMFGLAKCGKLRIVAVMNDERLPALPSVPTFKEEGFAGIDVHVWYGLLGPAALPAPILSRLNTEINAAIAQADVKDIFEKQSLRLIGGAPERLAGLMKSETDRWNRVVKDAGIKAE